MPSFEGPLDILLRLIERDRLVITEVSLVDVTDQFLDYIRRLGLAPAETLAEFASVAARLVLLKSRSLLPRPPLTPGDEADPDELVRQLSDYRLFRDAALRLAERDTLGAGAFAPGGGIVVPGPAGPTPLAAHQPLSLARAIRRRFSQVAPPVETLAARPILSLGEVVARALTLMTARGRLTYREMLTPEADRHEALTAFLAMLVLVRRRVFDAEQTEAFGEITLRPSLVPSSSVDLGAAAADD